VGKKKETKNNNKRKEVLRKPSQLPVTFPGEVVSTDSIEVRGASGEKRYVVTIIDIYSRFSHAVVTSSHTSKTAMSIFKEFQSKFPFPVKSLLTDNGSEFMGDFSEYLEQEKILHYHTYP
jgi:IS30 family transposase